MHLLQGTICAHLALSFSFAFFFSFSPFPQLARVNCISKQDKVSYFSEKEEGRKQLTLQLLLPPLDATEEEADFIKSGGSADDEDAVVLFHEKGITRVNQ